MRQKGMEFDRAKLILPCLMFIGIFMASPLAWSQVKESSCLKCHLDLGGKFARPGICKNQRQPRTQSNS